VPPRGAELHAGLSGFAGLAVQLYTAIGPELPSRCSLCWKRGQLQPPETPGVELPSFMELEPSGAEPGQDLPTLLRLPRTGKAMLAVRPDGYIAVSHWGGWDAAIVVQALREVGLLVG